MSDATIDNFLNALGAALRGKASALKSAELNGLQYATNDPAAMQQIIAAAVRMYDHMECIEVYVSGVWRTAIEYQRAYERLVEEGGIHLLPENFQRLLAAADVCGEARKHNLYLMEPENLCAAAPSLQLIRNGLKRHQLLPCSHDLVFSLLLSQLECFPENRKIAFHMKPIEVGGRPFIVVVSHLDGCLRIEMMNPEVLASGVYLWAAVHNPQ